MGSALPKPSKEKDNEIIEGRKETTTLFDKKFQESTGDLKEISDVNAAFKQHWGDFIRNTQTEINTNIPCFSGWDKPKRSGLLGGFPIKETLSRGHKLLLDIDPNCICSPRKIVRGDYEIKVINLVSSANLTVNT